MAKSHEIARTGKALKLSADKIVMLPVSEVRPYEKNPRKNADAVKFVKASIEQFGFKVPIIIDSNRVIVCGHTRLEAAKSIGMAEVPCIVADDLTDAQVKALRLADNKVAEFSEWEMNLLGEELGELAEISDIDMGDFGFDLSEFDNIGMDAEEKEVVEDEVPEEVEPVCKKGELWLLGEHRLMCGDSTKAEDFEKLMAGEKADLTFTSPPYNGDNASADGDIFVGKGKQRLYADGYSDNLESSEYVKFAESVLAMCFKHTDGFIFWNVNYNSNSKFEYIQQIVKFLPALVEQVCWKKSSAIPFKGCMRRGWEPVYIFSTTGKNLGLKEVETNIWEISNTNSQGADHKACFPVALPAKGISIVPAKSGIVLEPFGGTGTTMIACEQLGRKCRMMELDPHYCTVIIARWEKLTGQKAIKLNP